MSSDGATIQPARPTLQRRTEGRRHIFILGLARTGSSVLRNILNGSDHIAIASETHFMRWSERVGIERLLTSVRVASDRSGDPALDELVAPFYADGAWKWIGRNVPVEMLRERLADTDLSPRGVFALLMDLFADSRAKEAPDIYAGEKTPSHLYYAEKLRAWFPEAKILHTFRDPRAIYHSELRSRRKGNWGPKALLPWLPSAVIDPLLAPLQVAHTTTRWLSSVRFHERNAAAADRYRLVRFEDLVTQPRDEVRQICDFLEVPYQSKVLDDVFVVGSSFEQNRRGSPGIAGGAASRWAKEIHPLAASWFSVVLARHLKTFGYAP